MRTTYEELREKHGFRITDYKVDSDSASPRVCFSSPSRWPQGRSISRPSLRCPARRTPRSRPRSSQLCVDGLKHSERYAFVLRQGLPSSVGESLLKSADYEVYVRDRSPQVRFTGRNYVLPRTGQEGIPLVSVNTAERRCRGLPHRRPQPLCRRCAPRSSSARSTASAAETIATEKGVKIWNGTLETKSELNRDVVTAFPVIEAVGKLEPGVYVMIGAARRAPAPAERGLQRQRRRSGSSSPTSGSPAFTGKDGVHVLVRSLATRRAARQCRDPPHRPQQRGAGDEIDRCRRPCRLRSRPRARRGRQRAGPDRRLDRRAITASSTSARAAFDLTDRGVKGRVAPGAVDAYSLHRARRLPLRRDGVRDGAPARRARAPRSQACR